MSTQTATLNVTGLREETLKTLAAKAKDFDQTPEEYVREMLEDKLSSVPAEKQPPTQTDQEGQARATEDWMREWKALAQRISVAIPDGPSLVDTLIEMRR